MAQLLYICIGIKKIPILYAIMLFKIEGIWDAEGTQFFLTMSRISTAISRKDHFSSSFFDFWTFFKASIVTKNENFIDHNDK